MGSSLYRTLSYRKCVKLKMEFMADVGGGGSFV